MVRRSFTLALSVTLLLAGAVVRTFAAPLSGKAAIDEILAEEERAADDYVEKRRCIPGSRIRGVHVLSGRHIVFQTGPEELWLVQLRHRCPGLSPGSKVALERSMNRLCKFDSVRVAYGSAFRSHLGPRCQLAEFESVSLEQVTALHEDLNRMRSKRTDAQ